MSKGMAGFTDHGIELKTGNKVIGGIVEITQDEKALDKFFLVAPELSYMIHEFATEYALTKIKEMKLQVISSHKL